MLNERFWSKVNKDAPNGCWEWTASKNNMGYGMFSCRALGYHDKKLAHRLSYTASKGDIPDGLHIMHACDNPACVNPAHLSAGTRSDNMRDCANKFRHTSRKVTHDQHRQILHDYIAGKTPKEISADYRIPMNSVSDYTSGRIRAWLLGKDGFPTLDQIAAAKQTKPGAKITADQVRQIKADLRDGLTGVAIAAKYGLHKATVSDIRRGKIWRDVD